MKNLLTVFCILLSLFSWAQTGIIEGRVYNEKNNEPVPFANVVIQGTTKGASTDLDGKYRIEGLEPGQYNLVVSYIGFKKEVLYEIQVTNNKPAQIDIGLAEDTETLEEVKVTASPFNKTDESPVSLRTIGVSEIERNPGGNRDISRVIQSLPGVASSVSFRNDIIIRGGAPNENRFYLDGIEVPNINHFSTQGSSGGPVGMINVNFIREVDYYAGAFPANRGNALSSVFEFKQKDPRTDRFGGKFTVGATDFGLTLEGPVGEKSSIMFSARRSYLQFLFKVLELPFLPIYNDFQFKSKTRIDDKNIITVVGLGAIDNFELNTEANETEFQQYILSNLPVQEQWNYTIGANWKHFRENGYSSLVASRSMLNNTSVKYKDNVESSDNLLLDYVSQEMENKVRWENDWNKNRYRVNYGVNYEYARYTNSTYQQIALPNGETQTIDFDSNLDMHKWGFFGSVSRGYFSNRLTLALGIRADANNYSEEMINLLDQLSPRFSLSYSITDKLSFNFNTGRYYQLPAYTVLGFRDLDGNLVNRENDIKYISSDHLVAGLEYRTNKNNRFTVEGFYKMYDNYPFLVKDSISLANLGADFGVIGNEEVTPTSEGRSYGVEFLAQQKLYKGFYGILAYTWVKSEFRDKTGEFKPSAWDNGHIISITGGKKFKKNWEVGLKWRYLGGAPYTPVDVGTSSLKPVWDVRQQALLNYDQLNSKRLPPVHQLDVRVDKKYYFKKWSLNIYLDIENAYNFQAELPPYLNVRRNENGDPVTNPDDPSRYETYFIENTSGTVIPSFGLIIEL